MVNKYLTRAEVEKLPPEEIRKLLSKKRLNELEHIEEVFATRLQHITDDKGKPISGIEFTSEELATLYEEKYQFNPEMAKLGFDDKLQRYVFDMSDTVRWAKKVIDWDLRPHQVMAIRNPSTRKVLRWGRRSGKALALDTPIPTPTGWTTMGDISVGDYVLDEKGKATRVVGQTEIQYGRPCFLVKFSDGSKIVADAEHEWFTWTKAARKSRVRYKGTKRRSDRTVPSIKTTQEIYDTLLVGKKNEANHSITTAEALNLPSQDLLIDPYVLGAWLGDGSKACGQFTNADSEIILEIESAGFTMSRQPSTKYSWTIVGLLPKLRQLSLLKNKHIPEIYLRASIEQRLALLQGLMDTDGDITSRGQCTFNNSNLTLIENVHELIGSLGWKSQVKSKRAILNGKDCGPTYRIVFFPDRKVFRLTRKLCKQKTFTERVKHRYIVDVKPVDSVPVKCIEVNSENHLYLAGKNFIPTHNSNSLAVASLHYCATTKEGRVLGIMPYKVQAEAIFKEILKLIRRSPELESMVTGTKQQPAYEIDFANGSSIILFTAGVRSGGKAGAVRGQEADILIIDEVDQLDRESIEATYVMLQRTDEEKPEKRLWAASTPTGKKELFFEWATVAASGKEEYEGEKFYASWMPSYISPFWDEKIEADFRNRYTPNGYRQEIEADWGEEEDGVYPRRLIQMASSESYEYSNYRQDKSGIVLMGVDFDKYGAGSNIVAIQVCDESDPEFAGKLKVIYRHEVPKSEFTLSEAVKLIKRLNASLSPMWIYLDRGYGEGQIEQLQLAGKKDPSTGLATKVKGIAFSEAIEVVDPATWKRVKKPIKPFMVDNLRTILEQERLAFSFEDEELFQQLLGYVQVRQSVYGQPIFGSSIGRDHAHDALALACLAYTVEYGFFSRTHPRPRGRSFNSEVVGLTHIDETNPSRDIELEKIQSKMKNPDAPLPIARNRTARMRSFKRQGLRRRKF